MTYEHTTPKLSVVIPIHDMKGGAEFLWKTVNVLMEQSFQDFEIVISKNGKGMAGNTNGGILRARGELVKILYLDDILGHKDALKEIVEAMDANPDKQWLITSANNNLYPYMTPDIEAGNNKLGSPSALTMRNRSVPMLFDEKMTWLLDCDYYKRMQAEYGDPIIIDAHDGLVGVVIGEGDHQVTHQLSDEEKLSEHKYMNDKYGKQ